MARKPYSKFTPEEIERAVQLRRQGLSYAAIGLQLGRPGGSVEHRVRLEMGDYHTEGRTCSDCGMPIPNANKTGYCRKHSTTHLNYDPEFRRKRLAGMAASDNLKPGSPARKAAAKKAVKTRFANPQYVAWLQEFMRTVVSPKGNSPEAHAKRNYTEIKRKLSERYMGWCPPEYRDAYRHLVYSKNLKAAEAREIILSQVKADIAKLSPFERQMRALENGAALVANDQKPSLANPGYYEERKAG